MGGENLDYKFLIFAVVITTTILVAKNRKSIVSFDYARLSLAVGLVFLFSGIMIAFWSANVVDKQVVIDVIEINYTGSAFYRKYISMAYSFGYISLALSVAAFLNRYYSKDISK